MKQMKNNIKYIAFLFIVTMFFSCDDTSIQEKRDAEKAQRLNYIREHKIPDSTRQLSGLYYIPIKEGEGDAPQSGKHRVYVFYTFYHLDGTLIKQVGLAGKFEPHSFDYNIYNTSVKPALTEAVGKMKEGGKARLIIPSSLNNGSPYLGVETMSTNEFYTVICDLELYEIRESQDPDTEF